MFDRNKLSKDIKASKLTKSFISEKADIHRAYLHMILNGTREPSGDVVTRIYRVLNGKFVLGK